MTVIWHFLYNHLAITDSFMGLETIKGSEILLGLTPKFTAMSGVTKERFESVSNNI